MTEDFHRLGRRHGPFRRLLSSRSRPEIVTHAIVTPRWTAPPLTVALLADFHATDPFVSLGALREIVQEVNGMPLDAVLLLGDYIAALPTLGRPIASEKVIEVLADLWAPLGVHAILGNHDWKDDPVARTNGHTLTGVEIALRQFGLDPLNNASRRLQHGGTDIWLVGMDSQRGHLRLGKGGERHDPDAAFADVPKDAPTVLMAHEPDYFAEADPRPALQVSGHTHGGQGQILGWRPMTPSAFGSRYAHGHIEEDNRYLVVSGGLGYTTLPLRVAQPPEITLVRLAGPPQTSERESQ